MSPRSHEFIEQAKERLVVAEEALGGDHFTVAVSLAYYAMLNAARAALSEDDEQARSHRGTWKLFRERYVITDAFEQDLFALAHRAQEAREKGDYEAASHSAEAAGEYVTGARDFIVAVEAMLAV